MRRAKQVSRILLDGADAANPPLKAVRLAPRAHQAKMFKDEWQAAASVPRSGWREWREAGVQFSKFHQEGTPFALPFNPDSYLWDEAWGWSRQDGNHRFEALLSAGAATYDAFLGKPKKKQPFDSF